MSDLTDFLLARITEDEADVRRDSYMWQTESTTAHPARVLAECEAKRCIVEHAEVAHERAKVGPGEGDGAWFLALRYLALPYVDHPDFNPEWKVA